MSSSYNIGIVALSEDRDDTETMFYVTDADSEDEEWKAFVVKCNALLKVSDKSHATLVYAAIKYGTMDKKLAERAEFGECIAAFMGEEFDLSSLGTWKEVKRQHEFNRMVIDEDIKQTFVFTYQENQDS